MTTRTFTAAWSVAGCRNWEQTSRSHQSSTGVSTPIPSSHLGGVGLDLMAARQQLSCCPKLLCASFTISRARPIFGSCVRGIPASASINLRAGFTSSTVAMAGSSTVAGWKTLRSCRRFSVPPATNSSRSIARSTNKGSEVRVRCKLL